MGGNQHDCKYKSLFQSVLYPLTDFQQQLPRQNGSMIIRVVENEEQDSESATTHWQSLKSNAWGEWRNEPINPYIQIKVQM